MRERRGEWRLPEAVFDMAQQPLALVKDGLDAAIKSGMMKRNSYHMCLDTGAIIVDANAVDEIAMNLFEERFEQHKIADEIVARSLRRYRRQQSPVPMVELPAHEMPVMLSA